MILLSNIKKSFANSQIFLLVILIHIPVLSPFFLYIFPAMHVPFLVIEEKSLPFPPGFNISQSVDDSLYVCLK